MLAVLICFTVVVLVLAGQLASQDSTWLIIFECFFSSSVLMLISVIPTACHQVHKTAVRFVFILVFVVLGLQFIGMKHPDIGWAILIGGGTNGLQWMIEMLVCTNQFREQCRVCLGKSPGGAYLIALCCCLCEDDADPEAIPKADPKTDAEADSEVQKLLVNNAVI